MRKQIKKFSTLKAFFFFLIGIIAIIKLHYFLTDGFKKNKIHYCCCYHIDLETSHPNRCCFDRQTFHYIGKGRQVYVFANDDETLVIKFLRYHKYQQSLWLRALTSLHLLTQRQIKIVKDQKRRYERAMTSYLLAFRELQDETNIYYMHLNPTTHLRQTVYLKDRSGRRVSVNLDRTAFIIQRKAVPLLTTLEILRLEGKWKHIEKLLQGFISCILSRAEKGILNRDFISGPRNMGVLDEKIMELDLGSFYREKGCSLEQIIRNEGRNSLVPLIVYLNKKMPQMVSFLEDEMEKRISQSIALVCHEG